MPATANIINNPKVQHLKKRNQHLINLILEKVAGHLKDQKKYPLPADVNSPERAVYNLVKAVPKRRRDKFMERAGANLNATSTRRKQLYDELAAVDLKSSATITEQIKAITIPAALMITSEEVELLQNEMKRKVVKPVLYKKASVKTVPQQAVAAVGLRVSVESLTCNKKSEIAKEKISLGAFGIGGDGVQQSKDPFFVGKFRKGDTIIPGANGLLFDFPLDSSVGGTFPLSLSASIFLIEEDWIHNRELSEKLSKACFVIWGACMTATSAIITVGVLGGPATPFMAYLALAIGMIFLVIGLQILPLITDDQSDVVTDQLILDAPPSVGDIFNRTVQIRLLNGVADVIPGQYTATLRWEAI